VMPSLDREGLPRAAIEAMAQGVPAVVTDVGGMSELVRDGVEGFVVLPGRPPALADALLRLMRNPELRRMMGRQARERIRTEFSVERSVSGTLATYESVVGEGGAPCFGL
jgi:L-malate glycosyltransferase